MIKRVPQPPIDPSKRDRELHSFWPGFGVVVVSLVLCGWGAWRSTGVETSEGSAARETQLVKAFSSGGLEFVNPTAFPDVTAPGDPARVAAALEQWERENADGRPGKLRYRVNLDASTPCPT